MRTVHNKEQNQAISADGKSLLIIAGAGTGKTRVLVEKIIHLLDSGVSGDALLALTFTNRAADEMRNRVQSRISLHALPFIGTFHGFCVSLLRLFPVEAGVPDQFLIYDREACRRIIKRCMKQEHITDYTPRVLQYAIGRLKNGLAAEDDETIVAVTETLLPLYTLALKAESALDFDDLIIKAVHLLQQNKTVRQQVQSRYSHILVDEFQDIDGLQSQLISLLRGPRSYVTAVGDTDQTIYTWRGANVHNMLGFAELYAPADTILLTQNYRSTGTILGAANAVISKNTLRQEKILTPTRHSGNPITVCSNGDEEDEAKQVAQTILRLHDSGISYSDIAVLFRANFQARALETHMISNHIPYTVLGARFFDRAEVKDLLAYLTLVHNLNAREAFARAAGVPRRGIGSKTLEKVFSGDEASLTSAAATKVAHLYETINTVKQAASKHPVAQVLRELVSILDYHAHLKKTYDNPDERMYEVHELITFADRFSHLSGADGIAQLLAEVTLSSEQDTLRTKHGASVRLMTAHAAKGMEFSHVFITGLEEGTFPFLHDTLTAHDPEEERRLCYVAMTRAKDGLHLSFARRRTIFGQSRAAQPSSFLLDIPEHLLTLDDEAGTSQGTNDIHW